MKMKHEELLAAVRKGRLLPVYLLHGEDGFRIREALELFGGTVVDDANRDFNATTIYCRDTPVSELVGISQTLPFLSAKRLVVAKDVDLLNAAASKELQAYLHDPSPVTCLVMVVNKILKETDALFKAANEHGALIAYYAPLDRDAPAWIEAWARRHSLSIQRDAVVYLQQIAGNDLQSLENELQKIQLAITDKKTVTLQDVMFIAGDYREFTAFDLAAEVGRKNIGQALAILSRLLQEGESAVGLLTVIEREFRRFVRAKDMAASGVAQGDIEKKFRVVFHKLDIFREGMRKQTMDGLRAAFPALQEADRALKSSGIQDRLVLERLLITLCRPSEATREQ